MKRFLGLFLALILSLTSVSAFAEAFILRSGITFGDTMEDILAKEKTLTRLNETSNEFQGTIAGFDDASCVFGFDDDDKLKSMNYGFTNSTTQSSTKDNYKTLYESLVRKYGAPEGNTGGSVELITGPAITSMGLWVYLIGAIDGYKADYIDYDEWVIDSGEYNVKIDLVSYYVRDDDYKYTYHINLSYLKYTDAEYEAKIQEKKNEREAVDNDL